MLSASLPAITTAIGNIVNALPKTWAEQEAFHAGNAWAPVATAFFSNSVKPVFTSTGLALGEAAFSSTLGRSLTHESGILILSQAFAAYAMAAIAGAVPTGVPVPVPPVPPVGLPDFGKLLLLGGQPNHLAASSIIYESLLNWASTGTTQVGSAQVPPWS